MFDFATRIPSLAIVHHLLIFLLAGVLPFEVGVIRPNASACSSNGIALLACSGIAT